MNPEEMIIKTLEWKGKGASPAKKQVNYIEAGSPFDTDRIFHNLAYRTPQAAIRSMTENRNYARKRKNGIAAYHTIISFSKEEARFLTREDLHRIAHEFLKKRCINSYAFGKIHWNEDTSNPHIHLCYPGNQIRSQEVNSIRRNKYMGIRVEMDHFIMEEYPELTPYLVYHNAKEKKRNKTKQKSKSNTNEYALKHRNPEKLTQKEKLSLLCQRFINESDTVYEFHHALMQYGLEIYHYRNKPNGIRDPKTKKKYRFTTLGLDQSKFKEQERKIAERREMLEKTQALENRDRNEALEK